MSGIIGVSASEMARFSQFTSCLANLDKPPGTVVQFETGIDIAINRRAIVRSALESNAEWVWFVDDDMLFPPDHLMRLLSHEKDVVASLYMNRKPPFYPVAFNRKTVTENGSVWHPVDLRGAPSSGLVEIVAAGAGGLLVRTGVLHKIAYDRWFVRDGAGEDLSFCDRVLGAGVPILLDLAARMGHISTYAVWPRNASGQWDACIALTNEALIAVELGG